MYTCHFFSLFVNKFSHGFKTLRNYSSKVVCERFEFGLDVSKSTSLSSMKEGIDKQFK